MKLKDIIVDHSHWVVSVGWNHATPLELMAMIASELGEVAKCLLEPLEFNKLGSELADVLLRMGHMGVLTKIDFDTPAFSLNNLQTSPNSDTFKDFADLMYLYGVLVNKVRMVNASSDADAHYVAAFEQLFVAVMAFARKFRIHPEIAMENKVLVNKKRGTRGRPI